MTRRKIAVTHPRLGFGGSESLALWAIEALKKDHDVSLITGGPVNLRRLNAYYGTSIQARQVRIVRAPLPLKLWRSDRLAALRGAVFQRYCRKIAPQFDLLINTYGLCDFDTPAIQCIADFSFVREWRDELHPELAGYRRWWYGDSPLRRTYLNFCDAASGSPPENCKRNLTLANSHWTAGLLQEKFGVASQVVYPPVMDSFPEVPWEERENGFLCVGRVVPEKRVDTVIEILSRVRKRGADIHLHILGGVDDSPYGRKIKYMAARNRSWVFLEGWISGPQKAAILAAHRFGIHGRMHEPFGIAPAEMIKAGCIAFVPNGGGQTEIIGHPELTFENEDDAVKKIEAVLASPETQKRLAGHLLGQARKFSTENFMAAIRRAAEGVLAEALTAD